MNEKEEMLKTLREILRDIKATKASLDRIISFLRFQDYLKTRPINYDALMC